MLDRRQWVSGLCRLLALATCLVLLVAAVGCSGREVGSGNADPASVAPANAIAYFVADLQPEGAQGEAAQAIAARLPGVPNPDALAVGVLVDALSGDGFLAIFGDVGEPILGRRAALVVTGASAGNIQAAAVLTTTNRELAAARLREIASSLTSSGTRGLTKPVPRSYNGVDYFLEPTEGQAVGLVESFLVVGDEAALRSVVDASGGSRLSDHPAYVSTLSERQDAVASGYVDPDAFASMLATAGSAPSPQVVAARAAASQVDRGPVSLAVRAAPGQVTLSVVARDSRSREGPNPPTGLLPALPADAWHAVGMPEVGDSVQRARRDLSPAEAASLATFNAELRRETGLDLFTDIAPGVRDGAYFMRGLSESTFRIGAVLRTSSPAAAARLVAKVKPYVARQAAKEGLRVLPARVSGATGFVAIGRGAPAGVYVVNRGTTIVVAEGLTNTRVVLSPRRRLASTGDYRAAQASVGREPLFYLAFSPVTQFVATRAGPEGRDIARYLKILRTLAAGSDVAGGTETTRVVLTLR